MAPGRRDTRRFDVDRPWTPHHVPTAGDLKATVRAQFPEVAWAGLRPLGSGWEFDAWETPDGWVFRFPRRREAPSRLDQERRFLDLVRPVLAPEVAVPDPVLRGEPGPRFPWPFAGYRKVPGVGADDSDASPDSRVAAQVGRVLGRLHGVPPGRARAAGAPEDRGGAAVWVEEARTRVEGLRGRWPEVDQAIAWLDETHVPAEPYRGSLRLVHNDLCTAHVLLDPVDRVLTGILDWTDTALGDPALDFVFLVTWGGWNLVGEVLHAYDGPALDPDFLPRLRHRARILALVWLQEAVVRGTSVAQPLQQLRNAFAAPSF
jgi:aminoglycoside phosphotransferase (APT) family kinase protein